MNAITYQSPMNRCRSTSAAKGVEHQRGNGDESLTFTGLHLSDSALVEDRAADELDIELTHSQRSLTDFADNGEDLGHELVQRFAVLGALSELCAQFAKLVIGKVRVLGFEAVDLVNDGLNDFDLALASVEELSQEIH